MAIFKKLPIDSSVQAEYESGYVLDETTLEDKNPYGEGNTFRAILNREPEPEDGKMVRFSVFWKNQRYDIDWTKLSDNARPIRFRHGYHTWNEDGTEEQGWSGVDFGYQATVNGKNVQEVQELR